MLRMLLTLWHGGMVTGGHACDVLEWHWTISPSQVCDHIRRGDDMFTLPPATSVDVKWIFSQGHLLLHWTISPSQVCDHIRRGDDMFTLPPATSVDVKWIFSQGHLLLSHVRNRLSTQATHAVLCVGLWSLLGLVKDNDVLQVGILPDVEGDKEELGDAWDSIVLG
jgi:hypothetical protein